MAACGGGGGGSDTPAPPALTLPASRVSGATPLAPACTGGSVSGTNYPDAEVEPFVAIDPGNSNHLVGVWQQDRWSNGGSRAVMSAASFDGGRNWARVLQPMSRCAGATAGSAGDFERATDPWVDIGADGTVYMMGLAFSGAALQPGSASAMLASRSTDGGLTWSAPATLISDGTAAFNDKNTLSADPTDARYVYAVWDRLVASGSGPAWLARSSDRGASWEPARAIFTPPGTSQTIGNRIVVLGDGPQRGVLVNLYTQIDTVAGQASSHLDVIRSTDKGLSWSAPVRVAELQAVGARDPDTGTAIRDGATLASIAAGPGGTLWVAWQDARFSGGLRDAIAVSRSNDGGLTWSAPLAINREPGVSAFTPTVTVRADGTVGVTHYDLRSNTSSTTSLLADAWLLTSRDGSAWTEARVWGPFDMAAAPNAGGLFLGDYQGLVSDATSFVSFLVLASTDTANRTDVYALRNSVAVAAAAHAARALSAAPSDALSPGAFTQRRHEAIVRSMERRVPGWSKLMKVEPVAP